MRVPKRKPGKRALEKADLHFTEAKLNALKAQLDKLQKDEMPQAIAEVERLRLLGDFSENAAYSMAKGKLRGINGRITSLSNRINGAIIIRPDADVGKVQLGSIVTIEMQGKQITYEILGSAETNPLSGIISHNSPIGSALMGHRVGDTPVCEINGVVVECKIIRVQ